MADLPLELPHIRALRCTGCGVEHPPATTEYWCPACGPDGTVEYRYDYEKLKAEVDRDRLAADPDRSIRRFRPILPVPADGPWVPLDVGPAPLVRVRDDAFPPLRRLTIFDDTRTPSASLKDRATSVALARAMAAGVDHAIAASTGNAAASLACQCAAAGLSATILVPASAPRPKLAQLLLYGAAVLRVDGTYDDAFDLSLEVAAERPDLYLRSTGVNPALSEGKKTVALEIALAWGWRPPEAVLVSVGDGCIVGGIAKGFLDLVELGWIERAPRVIGVQSEGSRAVADAFHSGEAPPVRKATTLADSISSERPRDWRKAVAGIRATGGTVAVVPDDEILAAMRLLAGRAGVFAEPAGAAALAGALRLAEDGELDPGAEIVVVASGNGLKDTDGAFRAAGEPPEPIAPTLEAAIAAIG